MPDLKHRAPRGEPAKGLRSRRTTGDVVTVKPRRDRSGGTSTGIGDTALGGFREITESAPIAAFVKDRAGRYRYANPYLLATVGRFGASDWLGKTDLELWPAELAEQIQANDQEVFDSRGLRIFWEVLPLGDAPHDMLVVKFPLPSEDGEPALGGIAIDLTRNSEVEADRDRLATAISQAAESVVIADIDARITYVNPAFERVTGYTRAEVIGQNPRLLSAGVQPPSFYEAMWATLSAGSPWVADFVNRRKDGSLFTEEAVISPIRDLAGAITGYVAVKRDVTRERALEDSSSRIVRERTLIADTIRGLRARDTPEATAQAICRRVAGLMGIAAAQVYVFELDGRATPLGFAAPGRPDPPLRRLPFQRSRRLHERAVEGPWVEPWVDRPWHPYNQLLTSLGIRAAAFAPIRFDGRLIGILVIDSVATAEDAAVTMALPALGEFADLAGALIGRAIVDRIEIRHGRDMIQTIIDRGLFHPVFQPIVDLERGTVLGYEALTRFADGVAPDQRFGEAVAFDVGLDLEMATLTAAVTAARALPSSAWLDINASPELILSESSLRATLRMGRRPVIIEVTEHTEIGDYPAFRDAVRKLGPKVKLAIDDAGAGFSSLRHILELRPAFVKLDRWLVNGIDGDEARQAMVAGMHHFAVTTGCRLIAEGIETESERAMLVSLGVKLGQGYLLGRPEPA